MVDCSAVASWIKPQTSLTLVAPPCHCSILVCSPSAHTRFVSRILSVVCSWPQNHSWLEIWVEITAAQYRGSVVRNWGGKWLIVEQQMGTILLYSSKVEWQGRHFQESGSKEWVFYHKLCFIKLIPYKTCWNICSCRSDLWPIQHKQPKQYLWCLIFEVGRHKNQQRQADLNWETATCWLSLTELMTRPAVRNMNFHWTFIVSPQQGQNLISEKTFELGNNWNYVYVLSVHITNCKTLKCKNKNQIE